MRPGKSNEVSGQETPSVAILSSVHELPHEAITQVLDIAIGSVKSRLNTAIKTLRQPGKRAGKEMPA